MGPAWRARYVTVVRRLLALGSIVVVGSLAAATPIGGAAPETHTVTFDKYSLLIDGVRTPIWAGEFHYWRLPSPDLWRDVLEKMKAGGYNAANIYFDWGYHSPAPGAYDFSGVRDVDKLLDIADEVGIYVIARPGPYINAETDGGGFPAWLNRLAGKERSPDPDYLKYADEWMTQIDAILARHQLTNATGTIILDQVENEFYDGSAAGRAYMQHLEDKSRADGITVPLTGNHNGTFNAGVGALDIDGWDSYPQGFNCSNPSHWNGVPDYSGVRASLTDRPLFFPEYQGGAFDPWGGAGYDRCHVLIGPDFEKVFYETNIAVGSTMQSFYMTYGGTSWGFLPFPGVYTSYDYGAAIDESRRLTDKYDVQKLIGYFLAAATPVAKMDALAAASQSNPRLWLRGRVNPDDHTQLYVLRHNDGTSTTREQTHLTLDLSGRTGYTHDDVDAALQYSGTWTHASGQPWTAGDYRDTETFSNTSGDSVSIPFHGTAVRWISSLDGNHGIAAVSVDGQQVATVDTYGSPKQYQYVAYSVDNLTDADHTLTIGVTGQKNPASADRFVVVDAIDVPPVSSGEFYAKVPQEPGTAITIDGRDAKLLLANYAFGGQRLVYSTSQLLTQATIDGTDVAILHDPAGEDGETLLRYGSEPTVDVLSGHAASSWDAGRGDLRLDYTHDGLARVLVSGGGRPDLLLLLGDDATAAQFWRDDTAAGTVLARGPYLVRDASLDKHTLVLTGDTSGPTRLEVYAPGAVHELTWNGDPVPSSGTAAPASGPLSASLPGPKPAKLPALEWKYRYETPERDPAFDDSGWALADHLTSANVAAQGSTPVLNGDEYGFHHGDVWYHGHFTAVGTENGLFLNGVTGNSVGLCAAWLNGTYLGTGNGAKLFSVPPAALRPGQDNVVSVLVSDMGHDEGTGKAPRGLISAKLYGSTATITWRLQGNRGGEQPIDEVRGPLNNGGLYGERAGWSLPGFPDGDWQHVSLPNADTQPGVAWYRTTFDLHLPHDQDVPVVLRFADDPSRHYRVQIYLNGWNLGLYVNDVGPQHDFALPTGLLRPKGPNTLALAVWSANDAGGLGQVTLAALGDYRGGVRVDRVDSPGYEPARYRIEPALAHLDLSGPDQLQRGGSATVTATLSVADGLKAKNATVTLSLPDGWQLSGSPTVELGTVEHGRPASAHWTVTAPTGEQPWSTILTARATFDAKGGEQSVEAGKVVDVLPPAPVGDAYVSDLPFQSTNGWGPVERDTSNGEDSAGDGHPMTLGGVVYAKGLGAHAPGDITVYLGGKCASFTATVGIDAETAGRGSVRFHVLADGREVAATGVLTGASAPVSVNADTTGAHWLDLVLDDGGNGNAFDHSDWANAAVHCAST